MGAFPALPLGRRPVLSRLLVVYRLAPQALAELLPAPLKPRLVQGYAVAAACYTHLGSALRRNEERNSAKRRAGGSDHLGYRFAVERADGTRATWIARRETSSWFEARCGAKLLRGEYGRSKFRVEESPFGVELRVEGERGEQFYLRGEASHPRADALFPCGEALEDFWGEDQPVRPYDVFAPEADELDLAQHFSPEPLSVFEARSAFLSEGPLARAAPALDSAWRLVTRRLALAPQRRQVFRVLGEPGTQALPTV
jgi:hypothetical protein